MTNATQLNKMHSCTCTLRVSCYPTSPSEKARMGLLHSEPWTTRHTEPWTMRHIEPWPMRHTEPRPSAGVHCTVCMTILMQRLCMLEACGVQLPRSCALQCTKINWKILALGDLPLTS